MMQKKNREIDLFLLAQHLWRMKWAPVLLMLVCGAAAWAYYASHTTATYTAFFQLRLPSYCSNRDIRTAIAMANSAGLREQAREQAAVMNAPELSVFDVKDTTMIQVDIQGADLRECRAFTEAYLARLTDMLDAFAREQLLYNTQIAALQKGSLIEMSADVEHTVGRSMVSVVQEAQWKDEPSIPSHTREIAAAALMGLFGGLFLMAGRFLYRQLFSD